MSTLFIPSRNTDYSNMDVEATLIEANIDLLGYLNEMALLEEELFEFSLEMLREDGPTNAPANTGTTGTTTSTNTPVNNPNSTAAQDVKKSNMVAKAGGEIKRISTGVYSSILKIIKSIAATVSKKIAEVTGEEVSVNMAQVNMIKSLISTAQKVANSANKCLTSPTRQAYEENKTKVAEFVNLFNQQKEMHDKAASSNAVTKVKKGVLDWMRKDAEKLAKFVEDNQGTSERLMARYTAKNNVSEEKVAILKDSTNELQQVATIGNTLVGLIAGLKIMPADGNAPAGDNNVQQPAPNQSQQQ